MNQKVIEYQPDLFKQEVTLTVDENLDKLKGKILAPRCDETPFLWLVAAFFSNISGLWQCSIFIANQRFTSPLMPLYLPG